MDLHAELARFNPDPELADWVAGTVQKLIDQAQEEAAESVRLSEQIARRDTELHCAQTKIQALTLELAHLRRMRFGTRSEAFSPEERDLFQDTLASDLAAAEAELARKQAEASATTEPQAPRAPRSRAGRQVLPDHLPRIEHRHEPDSCTCGQCGKDLVKIGEESGVVGALAPYESGLPLAGTLASNWMSSLPASSCIATSGRSMRAGPARPSRQPRSRPP